MSGEWVGGTGSGCVWHCLPWHPCPGGSAGKAGKTGKTAPGILPTKAFGILPAKAFNVSVRFFLQPLNSIDLKHLDCLYGGSF